MHYPLAEHGRVFSTRERGAQLRDELLAATCDDDELLIDFENVLSATHSFLDEFVGKLAQKRKVDCLNASATIERTVERVLARRTGSSRSFAHA